jgi:cytochrome c oxidase subunit III
MPTAHQFDTPEQQFEASNLGMWLFLATEVLFFGGLFAGYLQYRNWYPRAFAAGSHELDVTLGAINTAILLVSSLTMALAVHAAQTDRPRRSAALLAGTIVLGGTFLAIKAVEYAHKFAEGLVPGPSFVPPPGDATQHVELFVSFYFALTGLHALHMVVGIGLLAVLTVMAWRRRYGSQYYTPVELTGLYWHFVDIVWVFLFPLFYLIHQPGASAGP